MTRGLKGPLQRGSKDFVVLEGDDYVSNRIETLVAIHADPFDGTGELEWRQADAGTMTERLRHRNQTAGRLELATVHLAEQLRRWEPDLVITKVGYSKNSLGNVTALDIHWDHKRTGATGAAKLEVET